MENHCQLVIVDSCPVLMNKRRAGRLVKKAIFTVVLQ